MDYRIAVDTGGTFTDVVVADNQGRLFFDKALTTHDRMYRGASEALGYIAQQIGTDLDSLISNSSLFIYGTTRATNAIVENKTATTAFLTTEGHPDVLVIKEGGKHDPFDFTTDYPEPYVPKRLTYEIGGRIGAEGQVISELNEDDVREAIRRAKDAEVEAIAVCLLWSITNPTHELRVREIIEEEWPGVPVTLSHELNPTIREYRRASSATIDASLKPLMQAHLTAIQEDLTGAGFRGELVIVTSFGGALHVNEVVEQPIFTVGSGPSMAPVAAKTYGEGELNHGNIIVCDSGGTTFDVSLIEDMRIKTTRETWLGPRYTGHITGLSSVEVTSVGAGGGSIAWIDEGGLLRVGPHSAGSEPGPVAYGKGGELPTVTDAATVLGYFDPDHFLGGRMTLDAVGAEAAIQKYIADPLGIDTKKAAWAILAVANEAMIGAVRNISINQGVDTRECIYVAGGGAGPLNAVMVAKELGCRQVLIPKTVAALSATGAHFADLVAEVSASRYQHSDHFNFEQAQEVLDHLNQRLDRFAERLPEGLATDGKRSYGIEARYPFQVWDLEVDLEESDIQDEAGLATLVERFHEVHERNFAIREPGQGVEWNSWKARLTAPLDAPNLKGQSLSKAGGEPSTRVKQVYFDETGLVDVNVYDGSTLPVGYRIEGPAIVEEPTSTIVLPPHSVAEVTELGSLIVDLV